MSGHMEINSNITFIIKSYFSKTYWKYFLNSYKNIEIYIYKLDEKPELKLLKLDI